MDKKWRMRMYVYNGVRQSIMQQLLSSPFYFFFFLFKSLLDRHNLSILYSSQFLLGYCQPNSVESVAGHVIFDSENGHEFITLYVKRKQTHKFFTLQLNVNLKMDLE